MTATTDIYTLSLHDALPIPTPMPCGGTLRASMTTFTAAPAFVPAASRSEEHTSELQSHSDLVCRLLPEKKKPSKSSRWRTLRPPPSVSAHRRRDHSADTRLR